MGNTQSNKSGRYSTASGAGKPLSTRISGPQSLGSANHNVSPAVRRRASANPVGSSHQAPRGERATHRRAQSALAASSNSLRNRDTAPPPTYSMAIADTSHLSPPPSEPLSPVTVPPNTPLSSLPTRTPSHHPSPGPSNPSSAGSSFTRVMTMPAPQQPQTSPLPDPGPSTSRREASQAGRGARAHSEDPFELLRDYNTVFVIDDSSSMRGQRWEQVRFIRPFADPFLN